MRPVYRIGADLGEVRAALVGLVAQDMHQLRNGSYPPLYRSGVRYQPEPPGRENWSSVRDLMRTGHGDCEDLAAWRAAELRLQGVDARPEIVRTGPGILHAVVRLPDGKIEDPSKRLGLAKWRKKIHGPNSPWSKKEGRTMGWQYEHDPDLGLEWALGSVATPHGKRYVIAVRAHGDVDVSTQTLGDLGCYHEVLGAADWMQALGPMLQNLVAKKGAIPGFGMLQFPGMPGALPGMPSQFASMAQNPMAMFSQMIPGISQAFGKGAMSPTMPGMVAFGSGKTKQDAVSNLLNMANGIPGLPVEAKAGIAAAGVLWQVARNPKVRKFAKKTLKHAKKKVKKLWKKVKFWK